MPTERMLTKILTLLTRITSRQEEMRLNLPLPPVTPPLEDRLQMQRLLTKMDSLLLDLRRGFHETDQCLDEAYDRLERHFDQQLDAIKQRLPEPPRGFDG
jgi:hypothetical protein